MNFLTGPAPGKALAGLLAKTTPGTRWRALQRRFDQRNGRERALLIAAAVALMLMAADALWLSPALTAFKAARAQQLQVQRDLAGLLVDTQQLQARGSSQARAQQAELAQWRQRVRDGDSALRRHEDALVGPDGMVALLEQWLARHGEVRVRAMRSLGRSDLLGAAAPAPAAAASATGPALASANATPTLYRHGVELELEGGFADLLGYLQAMESLPQRVLWGSVHLKVEQHPRSVLTLRVYTLSRDRHWLEI
jgi:MSHA biogenesis protein MshJ